MGGGGMGGPGGDMGPQGGGMPQFKALVRWESALPLAHGRKADPLKEAAQFYILSVSGLPGAGGARRGPNGEAAPDDAERRAAMMARIKEGSKLQPKGKPAFAPDRVMEGSDNGKRLLAFLFPREDHPIVLDDKEVTFSCQFGPVSLKSKFVLKDMLYQGKLEL